MKSKISKKNKNSKARIELDVMGWWILGVLVLVIVLAAIFILAKKGQGGLDFLKNIFRFGR